MLKTASAVSHGHLIKNTVAAVNSVHDEIIVASNVTLRFTYELVTARGGSGVVEMINECEGVCRSVYVVRWDIWTVDYLPQLL